MAESIDAGSNDSAGNSGDSLGSSSNEREAQWRAKQCRGREDGYSAATLSLSLVFFPLNNVACLMCSPLDCEDQIYMCWAYFSLIKELMGSINIKLKAL